MAVGDLGKDLVSEAASSAVPGMGALVGRLWEGMTREWETNRSIALRAAQEISGLSREDLAERIDSYPELVPALTRVLWEAAMTGRTKLLESMGAVFGAAIDDLEHLPDYEMVLTGLSSLTGTDILVLKEARDRHVFHQQTDDEITAESNEAATVLGIADRLNLAKASVAFGLRRLENQGFVSSMSVLGGTRFTITELGLLLYDVLERMADFHDEA
ncbi:hypothetical protein GL325_02415 [Aeromicrobium sp. 636]|uniref:Uncharacterized protein n=1 Tax=Aeromicrobium senzhongii TaxID=2663859 RepID=A0A8I0ETB3_9ACTN|nr:MULTISPECIES: hypothetical protein [Aeromicrobium]MBC9225169.1 hypothetical protein [Aeromicrobium senzhongii]MCQ3997279.1 hypothetical protein [Aeromicrobium sp. 636]